jgi:hypothetical protein
MDNTEIQELRSLTSFDALVDYLRDELDWPIEAEDAQDVAFDYSAEELGIAHKRLLVIQGRVAVIHTPSKDQVDVSPHVRGNSVAHDVGRRRHDVVDGGPTSVAPVSISNLFLESTSSPQGDG